MFKSLTTWLPENYLNSQCFFCLLCKVEILVPDLRGDTVVINFIIQLRHTLPETEETRKHMLSRYVSSICPLLLSRAASSLDKSQWTLDAPVLTRHLDCPPPTSCTTRSYLPFSPCLVTPAACIRWWFLSVLFTGFVFSEQFRKMEACLPSLWGHKRCNVTAIPSRGASGFMEEVRCKLGLELEGRVH